MPGESYGQRSLVGYSPWDCKESDTTEATEQAHEFFIGFPGGKESTGQVTRVWSLGQEKEKKKTKLCWSNILEGAKPPGTETSTIKVSLGIFSLL